MLKRDEKLFGTVLRLLMHVFSAFKFDLKSKLSHKRFVLPTGAPERNVTLRYLSLVEVDLAERQEHLFDDSLIHQDHFFIRVLLEN